MAILAMDFLAALRTLKATGEPQSIGSFKLSTHGDTGGADILLEQHCLRVDPLGYEAPFYSVKSSGYRYWPTSEAGLRKVAERLYKDEEAELDTRRRHGVG